MAAIAGSFPKTRHSAIGPVADIRAFGQTHGMNRATKLALFVTVVFMVAVGLTLLNYSFGHNAIGQSGSDFLAGQRERIRTAIVLEAALLICAYVAILLFARRKG
ncbi:hypothetical protein [Porphyrobacter sp. YT40]|uniref:hypothetical protein n=1 Tax=Porphyrobacter sp. YT40 TaxID=2547601 RepID=UPI0011438190|nr:hypothetical protein [Porphyrobacter sp. YT40]QDH33903.1 hypothetical protein E2E27_05885 [Porphyrobacter sp. YT40]